MNALTVERRDGVALVGLDRPEKRNALDAALVDEIRSALADLAPTPAVVVFHSMTPGMFVAGADIAELRTRTAADAIRRINGALFDEIAEHPWPTIAAIDGPALGGGCELSLACDFRVISPRASFGQPELRLGILAGAGANWRLERLAGLGIARRMLLAGERLDASAALAAGLADAVADDPLAEAISLSTRIAENSWDALRLTKLAIAQAAPPTTARFDAAAQALLFESPDKAERMDAFLQRKARP